jgi:hypothetical protein
MYIEYCLHLYTNSSENHEWSEYTLNWNQCILFQISTYPKSKNVGPIWMLICRDFTVRDMYYNHKNEFKFDCEVCKYKS